MGLLTFKGGIHPFEGKEMSMDKQVVELWPTGEMVYPLSQHIGAPAKPLVKKGDRVLRGQKIAEAGGFISAHIHSSCSGTVKAIEARRTSGGNMVMSIVVDNDGQFETVDFSQNLKPLDTLAHLREVSLAILIEIYRQSFHCQRAIIHFLILGWVQLGI